MESVWDVVAEDRRETTKEGYRFHRYLIDVVFQVSAAVDVVKIEGSECFLLARQWLLRKASSHGSRSDHCF